MTKVYIFNKSNDISRFYDFKKFFQCIDSEISLTHCTEMSAVYQNMLNSQGRLTSLSDILVDFLPLGDRSLWVLCDQYEDDW